MRTENGGDGDQGAVSPELAAEQLRKAKADAAAAEAAARKAEREEAEASTPAAAARRAAVSEKDAAEARQAQVAALIPDFSKVTGGSLDVAGSDTPTAGTGAAGKALTQAAAQVANQVVERLGADDWRVLVTADSELADSDAAYVDAMSSMSRLTNFAREVLKSTKSLPESKTPREEFVAALPIIAAVAQAVPGILSLLSARRKVSSGDVAIDDLAASAAVAGALKGGNDKRVVFHDSFRVLPSDSSVQTAMNALLDERQSLLRRKLELEARPASGDTAVDTARSDAIALISSANTSIDTLVGRLTAVPDKATRSPLTEAMLREGLHREGGFGHVLLVKAQAASGMQLVNDKPLWSKDTFSVVAAATLTWALVRADRGDIVDAGVVTGTAQANGKIGDTFSFEPRH
jgi:hypothetical protein